MSRPPTARNAAVLDVRSGKSAWHAVKPDKRGGFSVGRLAAAGRARLTDQLQLPGGPVDLDNAIDEHLVICGATRQWNEAATGLAADRLHEPFGHQERCAFGVHGIVPVDDAIVGRDPVGIA